MSSATCHRGLNYVFTKQKPVVYGGYITADPMRCNLNKYLGVVFLAYIPSLATYAQVSDDEIDQRIQLSETYMAVSQTERAIDILEQLQRRAPDNRRVRQHLVNAYEALKRYDDALAMVTSTDTGGDPYEAAVQLAEMARLQFLRGNEATADSLWAATLVQGNGRASVYSTVYSSMLRLRLLDRAVSVLEQGRHDIGQPSLFRTELAYLYGLVDKHRAAMQEYLGLLAENQNVVVYVRNRLSRVFEQIGAIDDYLAATQQAVFETPDYQPYREILGWLYLEAGDYTQAFTEYKAIDALGSRDGRAIFDFAERVAEAGAYETALTAYGSALAYDSEATVTADALLGLARMHELWAESIGEAAFDASNNRQPSEHYDKAYSSLRAFLQQFPNDVRCADVLTTMAHLQRDVYFQLDQSAALFAEVTTRFSGSSQAVLAQLELGRLDVLRGDLSQAEAAMHRLIDAAIVGEVAASAMYELAQIALYRGDVNEAAQLLSVLQQSTPLGHSKQCSQPPNADLGA